MVQYKSSIWFLSEGQRISKMLKRAGLWKGLVARGAARSGSVAVPGACLSCRFLAVPAARAHPRPLVAESRARLRSSSGGMRSSWSEKLGLAPAEHVAVSFTGGNDVTVTVQAKVGDSIFRVRGSKPSPEGISGCSKAPSPGQCGPKVCDGASPPPWQIARAHEVELEAVCEGQLACATWLLPS